MLRCIAIDDESKALDVVELYINKTPFLKLEKRFRNSLEALDYINNTSVDLLFLDINMPDLNGIEFIQSLVHCPMVIFTTAYSEYAVQSYDFEAVDYLLKPFSFSRFLKAANKVHDLYLLRNDQDNLKTDEESDKFIQIKSGSEIYNINTTDIKYIEGAQNYVFIYTDDQRIMSLQRMKEMEQQLPKFLFCRVHKSYIVNLNKVSKIENHQVHLQDKIVPIGRIYKEIFFRRIKKQF